MELGKLKYPIGKFNCPTEISSETIAEWISVLEHFPSRFSELVKNLSKAQLDTPYRPEGWTVQQVVHHVYDSHHNAYSRIKWTLTEDTPLIKAYDEKLWANLFDSKKAPVSLSLHAIAALHAKWTYVLKGLSEEDFQKEFIHPEGNRKMSLGFVTGMYAWHSNHHFAHIENLMLREGWK
ncbi:MAG: putative metal-dependent hydrolase [Aequorivita sp.]|nr:putative metal-dependent hydrolase [Aequorivita sp.]